MHPEPMIIRMWRGFASRKAQDAYPRHLLETVRPKLEGIPGFRGFYLLRRDQSDEVEYQVVTMWESMEAVRAFAGDHPECAVVEPEAAAVLTRFDDKVRHYDVLASPTIDS